MGDEVNSLAHLGHCLTQELEEAGSSPSTSGEFQKALQVPCPADVSPAVAGNFSIGNWRAKIAQRAIDQKLSFDLQNSSCRSSDAASSAHGHSRLGVDGAKDQVVEGFSSGEASPARTTDDLVQWLVGVFQSRDAGRTTRTVVALKSLAQAGEMKRAEDMLALVREGILTLTREGWRMLQERYPTMLTNLCPPGQAPVAAAEQHAARSSRCPTYLLLGPRVTRQGHSNGESDDCRSVGGSAETASTGLSPIIPSRESSITWSDASGCSDRLQQVLSIDDEDELAASDTGLRLGHRDDWELQYMLNGVFDEVLAQLDSGSTEDLAALLQGARSRVLEWTVRRWVSCCGQSI